MSEGYKVKSVIFCDDVRQEMSGKEILIGVYNDTIVFGQLPAMLGNLMIRIALRFDKFDYKKFQIAVRDSHGAEVVKNGGDIPANTDVHRIFGIATGPMQFTQSGTFSVFFGIDDAMEEVGSFDVRTPGNPEEQQRLKSIA